MKIIRFAPTDNVVNVSIDPGMDGTGMALWDRTGKLACGVSFYPAGRTLEEKIDSVLEAVKACLSRYNGLRVYIERPAFMDTGRGNVAARSDSLVKLCAAAFAVGGLCWDLGFTVNYVDIRKWKGQLSKAQTKMRIERIAGPLRGSTHMVDAIGIGLYIQGQF